MPVLHGRAFFHVDAQETRAAFRTLLASKQRHEKGSGLLPLLACSSDCHSQNASLISFASTEKDDHS